MSRGWNTVYDAEMRVEMDGSFLTTSRSTSYLSSLGRAAITQGHKDPWDGFKIPNPYWAIFTRDDRPKGTWTVTKNRRQYKYSGCLNGLADLASWPGRVLPEAPPDAANQALINALEKLKDQKANLRVALSEADDVAEMIAQNARRIAQGIRHLKKGRFKKAFRAIRHKPRGGWDKELSSRILEFQYGVRPLVGDIHGAMEALADSRYGPGRRSKPFRVVGVVKSGDKEAMRPFEVNSGGYLPVIGSTAAYTEVRVHLWFSATNALLKSASEMGFTNPFATAWELLPLSCIIDWAWPAGDWLNTLDAHLGLEFRGGTQTTYRQVRSVYRGNKTSDNGHSVVVASFEQRQMNRLVLQTLPIPRPPRFENPLSLEHALNALALLVSLKDDVDQLGRRL